MGTVTLNAPAGTQFPLTTTAYTVNGQVVTVTPTQTATSNVTITTPATISVSQSVVIVAGVGNTATNPHIAGLDTLSVITSADNSNPVVSSPPYGIVAAAASQVVPTAGNAQSAVVATDFIDPLSATVEDAFGNPVLAANRTVTFTSAGSGASGIFANTTITDSAVTDTNGVATTTTFTANSTPGSYLVAVTSVALTGHNFSETNVAGAATKVATTSGSGQTAAINTAFVTPLTATIEDAASNPVLTAGTTVIFSAPSSGASGTFAVSGTRTVTVLTNGSGVATATTYSSNSVAGGYSVAVTSSGLTAATFGETNTVGPASKVVGTGGTGQSAAVSTAFATSLTATIEDVGGNAVQTGGTTVVFTAPAGGASGTFAGSGTNTVSVVTNGSGVATSTTFTANAIVGSYSVVVTSAGLTTATSAEANVAAAASQVVTSGGANQSGTVGTNLGTLLSTTVEDMHGNAVLVAGTR